MLRIFRATSPMSIGTYVFSAFSLFSGLAALGQLLGDRGVRSGYGLARAAQVPAAAAGAGMSVYTAALLAATSTPLWAAAPRLLAVRFGCSAMATGAAALSLTGRLVGESEAEMHPLDGITAVALAGEGVAAWAAGRRYDEAGVSETLRQGEWAMQEKVGVVLFGTAVPLALLGLQQARRHRTRLLPVVASVAVLAGGLLMRRVIMEAGNRSAERPEDYFRLTSGRPGFGT
jgi:formate-dependent nitrite reductase membrane component NrfD